jgi:hypothetical protein
MRGLADAVRIAAVLTYAVVMMMAVWTVLAYYDAYRRQRGGWEGLLPHHVWVIGLSYILYGAVSGGYAVVHFGDGLNAGAVLELVAGLVGLYGMRLVLAFEKRRVT